MCVCVAVHGVYMVYDYTPACMHCRCYAALGDVAKAKYLENVLELANAKAIEMVGV